MAHNARIMSVMVVAAGLALFFSSQASAGAITYTYDDAGRLVKADYGQGKVITYTYSSSGSLLERRVSTAAPADNGTLFKFGKERQQPKTQREAPPQKPVMAQKPSAAGDREKEG